MRLAKLLAATALLAGCAGPDSPKAVPSDEEAAIIAELEAYYADFSARDWEAFAGHFWEGARLATVWAPPGETAARVVQTSIPEFVAMAPEGPGSAEVFEEWPTGFAIQMQGPLAQAWVRYSARFGNPGEVREWAGVDAHTLLRHGGRWRIASLAWAPADAGTDAGSGAEPDAKR